MTPPLIRQHPLLQDMPTTQQEYHAAEQLVTILPHDPKYARVNQNRIGLSKYLLVAESVHMMISRYGLPIDYPLKGAFWANPSDDDLQDRSFMIRLNLSIKLGGRCKGERYPQSSQIQSI